ncbi:N-glycosylase/DNA lyase [Caldivirga maquilingensis]|uniref:DNA-(Apurinic or apyrimidinic site) lyase n=1 Tax=Caldivirga maquilingensis (strain ATCC 700844 / DSM 13496 / JCM 10307 / IC-167) TaxID=397948 RepID=A8MD22_CALMQ|nr:N-glycosylase/DNA lyase [Caldivirga maquilingensis]ABW01678.1 DNA-(apurinic or apyrimidinic site) lyase [Caldivirga maquilingensis IC-167]
MEVSEERVIKLSTVLRELSLSDVLAFEERDPQFIVVKELCTALNNPGLVAVLVAMNSIVSYMLTGRGERHWSYFSEYFSHNKPSDLCRDFKAYVVKSPYLARGREVKVDRIDRFCRAKLHERLMGLTNLNEAWSLLAGGLHSPINSKTIVFAVKMLYYAYRACGINVKPPEDLPIPVDYRIATLTKCSGLINAEAKVLAAKQNLVQETWGRVAELSGIPQVNLDALLWVIGGALIYSNFNVNSALRKLMEDSLIPPGKATVFKELVTELSRECSRGAETFKYNNS